MQYHKRLLSLAILFCASQQIAFAAPIVASETIEDVGSGLFTVDLNRTRTDSNGFFDVETNDLNIIAQNTVDNDFGIYNVSDVSFRHSLSWLNPLAANFISLTLEIKAFGVDGGNDIVISDSINLGSLVNDGLPILEGNSTSIFTNNNSATLNLILADGFLNISIDKNSGAFGLGLLDFSSIFSSKLTVEYDPIPEPLTLSLLASGLIGLKRRKR